MTKINYSLIKSATPKQDMIGTFAKKEKIYFKKDKKYKVVEINEDRAVIIDEDGDEHVVTFGVNGWADKFDYSAKA